MSTGSETSTYDYSSDEEAHNYNIDDPFYRGLTLPESMVLETPATNNSTTNPMEQFLCPDCSSALQARRAELAARRRELHVFLLATAPPKPGESAFVLRHAARALRQIGELVVGPLRSARREEVVCFPSHHFVATPNAAVGGHGVSTPLSLPGTNIIARVGGLSHLSREEFVETICYTCLTHVDDAKGFTINAPDANTLFAVVKSVDGPPEARNPAWGKIFYSLRTPRSVFANMSPEQLGAWENIGLSRSLRIRVDPE